MFASFLLSSFVKFLFIFPTLPSSTFFPFLLIGIIFRSSSTLHPPYLCSSPSNQTPFLLAYFHAFSVVFTASKSFLSNFLPQPILICLFKFFYLIPYFPFFSFQEFSFLLSNLQRISLFLLVISYSSLDPCFLSPLLFTF